MPTFQESMDEIKNHSEAFSKKMSESHAVTDHFINSSTAQADELIKAGKYQEGADVLSKMMDGVQAQQKTRWEEIARNSEKIGKMSYEQPAQAASSGASKFKLPEGISKGRIAAIAAGVAVAGGGIIMYRNHQKKKEQTWAARVEQQRGMAPQQNFSR